MTAAKENNNFKNKINQSGRAERFGTSLRLWLKNVQYQVFRLMAINGPRKSRNLQKTGNRQLCCHQCVGFITGRTDKTCYETNNIVIKQRKQMHDEQENDKFKKLGIE